MFYILYIILSLFLLIRDLYKKDEFERKLILACLLEDFKHCKSVVGFILIIFVYIFILISYPAVKLAEKLEKKERIKMEAKELISFIILKYTVYAI